MTRRRARRAPRRARQGEDATELAVAAPWSATGEVLATARASSSSPTSSTSCAATCRDIPTASASSCPTTAATTSSWARADAQGAARRPRRRARHRHRPARPAAKARSSRCSSARNRKVVGRLHAEHGVLFVIAENKRISQDILIPPDERGRREGRPGGRRRDHRAADRALASRSGAWSRCSATTTDPGMEIEIALRKHDLPLEFSDEARTAGAAPAAGRCEPTDLKGRKDLRDAAARDHRRRDREGLRRRGVLRAQGARDFRLLGRDRRRQRTTCAHGDALDRDGARARQLGVLPAPRDPDAARGAVQRAVLAQARRRPPVHGLRDGGHARRRDRGATSSTRRDALAARASPTRRSGRWLSDDAAATRREADALLPHLQNLYALFSVLAKAREKRGAIDFDTVEIAHRSSTTSGKIARIVPAQRNDAHRLIEECMLAANVCAADFLARARAARRCTACTRARRRRSSRRCARS